MNKEKLKQELLIMRTLQTKPNYSELARIYKCDRRTVKKYNTEFIENNQKRNRKPIFILTLTIFRKIISKNS